MLVCLITLAWVLLCCAAKGKNGSVATGLAKLIAAVDAAAEADVADDIDLDDCPDEFLDPLMDTLMNDPVDLPCKHQLCFHLLGLFA